MIVPALATASPATVTEYTLPTKYVGGIAQGPDGIVWFGMGLETMGGIDVRLGQLGPLGPISGLDVPDSFYVGQFAIGPEGSAWFFSFRRPRFGRLRPSGKFTTVKVKDVEYVTDVTSARTGGIWFTKSGGSGIDTVGRVHPNGTVTETPLPHRESGPGSIVEAKDGDVWFTEYFRQRVGRLTPSGELSEYKLGTSAALGDTTVDRKGRIWFTAGGAIWRIDAAGKRRRYKPPRGVYAGSIVAAPDGTLWFGKGRPGSIGRMTPSGIFSEIDLPDRGMWIEDLIAGREGNIFYTASSEGPCNAGGVTCSGAEPPRPATVGRISP